MNCYIRSSGGDQIELIRVRPGPLVPVERADRLDVLAGELEVKDVDVLPDPGGRDGLGEDDVAPLDVPAQDYLGWRLAVPAGDVVDGGIPKGVAAGDRGPGFYCDLVLGAEAAHIILRQVGVDLDLVDGRGDLAFLMDPPQMMRLEVGDADRTRAPVAVELL